MSTTTPRNQLIRPSYADSADVSDINTNMDKIDASLAKANYTATTAPSANDDVGDGYSPGSIWLNVTSHNVYMCEVATIGAAVWKQVNAADGALLANGTVPLTANWDAGPWQIRAETLYADVATGTAPFTVSSTTAVTNLNADKVDGKDESEFALLAGRAGGQALYGGTAASENLVLRSTSHATKGSIIFPSANLVVGTAATTASAYAMAIHEGAASAANKMVFMDEDGTTPAAGIWKDASNNLSFSSGDATTADAYVAASTGILVDNNGFYSSRLVTDPASSSNTLNILARPVYTGAETVAEAYFNIYGVIFPEIKTGHNNSSTIFSYYTECMRNHNGASTDDNGTLANLVGIQTYFGHFNSNAAMTGTTTNSYGIRISPYINTGTITNMYGMLIESPSPGGTLTNGWPIYTTWNAQHYFGGDIYTVGNCSALSFTDRTPGFEGDGISAILPIATVEGMIDHTTLPAFAQKIIEGEDKESEMGRDLGAMISVLTKAAQDTVDWVEYLYDWNIEQADRIKELESKNTALMVKYEDYERRMVLLEQRLAKLETP